MNKIIVGIDCDDILNDCMKGILLEHEKQTGQKLNIEDITRWEVEKFGIDGSKVFPRVDIGKLEPKINNIEALKLIYKLREERKNFEVYIVSQCPINQAPIRINFIKKYYSEFDEKKFIAIEDKSLLRLDYLVDDAVHNIEKCSEKGVKVYLVDMPHNRYTDKYHRIADLGEFLEILKKDL